jgi:lipopolysaccharide transport system permease protein
MMAEVRILQSHRSLRANLELLVQYRELILSWTLREVKARYRQSALGFGWALVQPVFQLVVISVIFGNFLRVPSENAAYPVFAYVAILPWTFFSGAINAAVPSILQNMQLVTKIYFPREILPLSAIISRLLDFGIASIIFIGLMLWYQVPLRVTLLYVPLLILILITLAMGVSLLGSAVSVYLRDISFAVPLVMQLWMYASPVIYPLSQVPENWQSIYLLNPMAGIIDSFRRVILNGNAPDPTVLGSAALVSLLLCIISYVYFKRLEMSMSDII